MTFKDVSLLHIPSIEGERRSRTKLFILGILVAIGGLLLYLNPNLTYVSLPQGVDKSTVYLLILGLGVVLAAVGLFTGPKTLRISTDSEVYFSVTPQNGRQVKEIAKAIRKAESLLT